MELSAAKFVTFIPSLFISLQGYNLTLILMLLVAFNLCLGFIWRHALDNACQQYRKLPGFVEFAFKQMLRVERDKSAIPCQP